MDLSVKPVEFCVVKGHLKSKLTTENVTSYVWTENEFGKGSNLVASCLFDNLNSIDMTSYNVDRLISDGCGGQNKNTILLSMVCYWFYHKAPVSFKEVQLVFPVTGHSFLPADRVFGNIEKVIKKCEVIISPEEYLTIIGQFATVKKLGHDSIVQDWKEVTQEHMKPPGSIHFGIQANKRIYFTRQVLNNTTQILVQGERNCTLKSNLSASAKTITKRGKRLQFVVPKVIMEGNFIEKDLKKKDVDALLKKHYGEEWRTNEALQFFVHVLDGPQVEISQVEKDECHSAEENITFQI